MLHFLSSHSTTLVLQKKKIYIYTHYINETLNWKCVFGEADIEKHVSDINTFRYSICNARRWGLGRGETRQEKDFIQLTRGPRSPLFSQSSARHQAKRMIAPSQQNINRVKVSQWFGELYSCLCREKITHAPKGREDPKRARLIYIKMYRWVKSYFMMNFYSIPQFLPALLHSSMKPVSHFTFTNTVLLKWRISWAISTIFHIIRLLDMPINLRFLLR